MKQKSGRNIKKGITNSFGSLGYFFCFLQWFWVIMLYFSVIQSVTLFVTPTADKQIEQTPDFTFTLLGPLDAVIVAIVTGIMIVITIYVLIKIPISIVKNSNKVVRKTTETMAPIVIKSQHKKDTKKNRAMITPKLALIMKLLLVIIPIALTTTSGLLEKPSIDYSIAMIVGCGLACLSVMFFAIQYVSAGLLHIKILDLR